MKKRVSLTESQLHDVIRRCINEVLDNQELSPEEKRNQMADMFRKRELDQLTDDYPNVLKKNKGQASTIQIRHRKGKTTSDLSDKDLYGTDQTDKRPLHRKGSLNRDIPNKEK